MEFSIKAGSPEKFKTDCVIVGLYADKKFTPTGNLLDALAHGALARAVKRGDATGKRAATTLLHGVPGLQAERVLLVGLGTADELNEKGYGDVVRAAFKALDNSGARDVLFCLAEAGVADRTLGANIRHAVVIARENAYRFDTFKSKKEEPVRIERIVFPADKAQAKAVAGDLAHGVALANGMELTKTLGNLPGNVCTPAYLADAARKLAREFRFDITVLERKQMQALKMGALLAVTQGSTQPPRFIVLEYRGGSAKDSPVVLVGKGITFDTGGISLKPGEAMDEMKYDMCGAASVLGTLRAAAELKLGLNVVGIIPTCENMPAGNAVKPGDIVTSMSGQTIEILNTDAEGRLILCDALTYAERFKPAAVIDIATLTGACIIALGHVNSGLFSPDDALLRELFAAGKAAGDPAWPLPLDEAYQEQLKSNFADMANIGGRPAGSITAASFLARFTKRYKWAHLDIAGTAWKSGAAKGATGRPVPLLVEFLRNRAEQ